LNKDVIGIRIARNAPVLFVADSDLTCTTGDRVIVELSDGNGANEEEIEATVVVDRSQMLHASVGTLSGRVISVIRAV
jgi:hypothetical protein